MKVLVPVSTGLGNFLLKLPLLQALKSAGAELVLLDRGEPWIAPLAQMAGLPLPQKWITRAQLTKTDIALLPFDSTPAELSWAVIGKASRVVQHTPPRRGKAYHLVRSLHLTRAWVEVPLQRHEIDLNMDLGQKAGFAMDRAARPTITAPNVSNPLGITDYLVIQPGAANGTMGAKVWPALHFDQLISDFKIQFPDATIVLVGDAGDRSSLESMTLKWESRGVVNLMGKTDLLQLTRVLADARLVLSHDSGIMHLANALGKPLLALYGPTDFNRTGPRGNARVLFSPHSTRGAMSGFAITERELSLQYPDNACMRELPVAEVLANLIELWTQ
jgi:ADP-heptose:LPS heptosyltransferase